MRPGAPEALCRELNVVANRVLHVILLIFSVVIVPITLLIQLVIVILDFCSFGLVLFAVNLVWLSLFFPLVGLSYLCHRIVILRNAVGLVAMPLAGTAYSFACCVPGMGEPESRIANMMLSESWPFCWEFWQFRRGQMWILSDEAANLRVVLDRISDNGKIVNYQRVIDKLACSEPLDAMCSV